MSDFVAVGDLHLTTPGPKGTVRGGLSAYIKDHDQFVISLVRNQVLRYAKKNYIKDVVFLGDICEGTRLSYEAQLALLHLLQGSQFRFHFILGNHDLFGADPSLGHSLQLLKAIGLPNVHIYESVTDTEIANGIPVRFLPWPHAKFSKSRLNIAHVDVAGAKMDSGRTVEDEKANSSNATAIIGHIHGNQQVRNSYFAGTLYQTSFGESIEKFFHHVRYEDGQFDIENVAVKPVYKLHSVEVASKKDLREVPRSEFDLVKLILLPGSKITADDYKYINVKKIRATTTERDLALARVEDLMSGSEVNISTDEFFAEWLRNQTARRDLKVRAFKLRRKLLKGHHDRKETKGDRNTQAHI